MGEYTNIQTERPPLVPTTEPEPQAATKKVETAEPPEPEPATATQGAGTAERQAEKTEPTTEQQEEPTAEQGQAAEPDAAADADAEPPAPEPQIEKVEQENYLMGAQEVAALLNVKLSMAYKIIRECNAELQAAGKLVIKGKVLTKYLLKKIEV